MDVLERFIDDNEVLRALGNAVRGQIMTAIPVRVVQDSDGHTAALQPLVKAVKRNADGSQELVDFPMIPSAPVNFASGGGLTSTMPIRSDDVGYALVMSRSIDVYQQQGNQQPQIDVRMHDLSDAVYCPGLKPDPQKLKNVSGTSAQTRTDDHKTVSDWSDTGITHAREDAVHNTSAGGIMAALKGALLSVTGKGIAASKGGSSHVVVDGAVSSLAPKVLLNC